MCLCSRPSVPSRGVLAIKGLLRIKCETADDALNVLVKVRPPLHTAVWSLEKGGLLSGVPGSSAI